MWALTTVYLSWIFSLKIFGTEILFLQAHLQVVYCNCVKFHQYNISLSVKESLGLWEIWRDRQAIDSNIPTQTLVCRAYKYGLISFCISDVNKTICAKILRNCINIRTLLNDATNKAYMYMLSLDPAAKSNWCTFNFSS